MMFAKMLLFAKENWQEFMIGFLWLSLIGLGVHHRLMQAEKETISAEKEGIAKALAYQSQMIDSLRVDYERKVKEAQKTVTKIEVRYQDRVKYIDRWKERESNVTCNDLVDSLDSYVY